MTKQNSPLMEMIAVSKVFGSSSIFQKGKEVYAVNDLSLYLDKKETYGLVGESGSGKTTVGRLMIKLLEPTKGTIRFEGKDLAELNPREMRELRRNMQMVFQDPLSSLNPRMKVGKILEEPMIIQTDYDEKKRREVLLELIQKMSLREDDLEKYPDAFSGGQSQRIALARALVLNPSLIICDEVVSALDISIQSQILNLLRKLQEEYDLSYLFITHDLRVVRHISDRIGVMYLGRIMEEAPTDSLFAKPIHPYTQALFSALPQFEGERIETPGKIRGEIPSPFHPPTGCLFHTRCPHAYERCKEEVPGETWVGEKHRVFCFLAEEKAR